MQMAVLPEEEGQEEEEQEEEEEESERFAGLFMRYQWGASLPPPPPPPPLLPPLLSRSRTAASLLGDGIQHRHWRWWGVVFWLALAQVPMLVLVGCRCLALAPHQAM